MKNYPKVSIIVLNWNGLKDTTECLESVRNLDYKNFNVIIVDNTSTDDSADRLKGDFPEITLLKNDKNLGFAGGNNVGIRYALEQGAQYVWLLNNDAVTEEDTLSKLIDTANITPKIGLLSPLVCHYGQPAKIQFCGSFIDWNNYTFPQEGDFKHNDREPAANMSLWGTALLIKRALIEDIGYLNERFFAYWEDHDYSMRSAKAGYENKVEPSARVFHKNCFVYNGNNGERRESYFYYMARNEYLFFTQNTSAMRKISFIRKYLLRHLQNLVVYKKYSHDEAINGTLDGLYSAIFNIYGDWDKKFPMPLILKRMVSSHPYFYIFLLEGNIRKMCKGIVKKTREKVSWISA